MEAVPTTTVPTTSADAALTRRPASRTALRLWRRLLSAGRGEVAELRGWDRLITWHKQATPRERWLAVKRFLKLPARAARQSLADVRTFGREVAEQAGVPRSRQFVQLWWLRVRHGLDAQAYIDYQLYRPERWRRAGEYIGDKEFFRVGRFIRDQRAEREGRVLFDKRLFDAWCRENDLPTVPSLLEIEDGEVTYSVLGDNTLPRCDLFSKPSDGTNGRHTHRWLYDGAGGYVGADGRTRQAAELLDELATMSRTLPRSRRILLQYCLRNHHALIPLTSGALSTVRIQTYRWPGGDAALLFAAYRMPVGTAPADNFHYGGIIAPVDPSTGTLGQALRRRGKVLFPIERHPDTGALIEGHRIPCWDESVRLALRAHDTIGRMAAVGWDIAVLEDGPVLVEGNSSPNPDIGQATTGVPLGRTPFVGCLNAYLRECFGDSPPP